MDEPGGERIVLGSLRLMDERGLELPAPLAPAVKDAVAAAQPITAIGWGEQVRGLFVFQEELRPEAAAALADLRSLGLDVMVLTGDHPARAEQLGQALGVPVRAELLPEDKWRLLLECRQAGERVAMVGDGINDAPALAASDVGIALGCGADVARDAAGVCLLSNDLTRIGWAVRLARRTVRVIRQNLFWAFCYNILGIALAAAGLLNPVVAALAMFLSGVLVLGNSLRLRSEEVS
jgi:P-type E1-E2 ATPase